MGQGQALQGGHEWVHLGAHVLALQATSHQTILLALRPLEVLPTNDSVLRDHPQEEEGVVSIGVAGEVEALRRWEALLPEALSH